MKKNGFSKLFNNSFFMFIILLFFFKPIYFQYNSNLLFLENIFVYGKIIVAFLIITDFFISNYPKLKINPLLIKIFLFELWILMITYIFNGNTFRGIINLVSSLVLVMFIIRNCLANKEKTINVFKNVIFTLVSLQLITEIIYSNGMPADLYFNNEHNALFFVTLDNGTTSLVCLCLLLINLSILQNPINLHVQKKAKLQKIFCLLTAIFSKSSTAIICTVLMLILFAFSTQKKYKFFEYGKFWITLYFAITLILVSNNNVINSIFKMLTGKEGFTGRTYLWSRAIEMIKSSPIIGYGIKFKDYLYVWGGYYSSHNTVLEILLEGGIVSLGIWCTLIFYTIKNLKKITDFKIKRTLLISLFVFLITLLMEASVHSAYLFSIIAIINAFHLAEKKIEDKQESR